MSLVCRVSPSFGRSFGRSIIIPALSAHILPRANMVNGASTFKFAMISRNNSFATAPTSADASATQLPDASDMHPYVGLSRPPKLYELGTKGNRILWLESSLAWGIYGTGEVHSVTDRRAYQQAQTPETYKEWTQRIKELIADDTQRPPSERIDSVVWYVESGEEPTAEMWQTLDGLSPKHLQMLAGFLEAFDVEGLGTLQHQWTGLETLCLSGTIESSIINKSPEVFSRISSLSLDYCCAQNLVPPGATHLKHLRIIENNACDMFSYAIDDERNPGLAEQLESLEIQTMNGCDMTSNYEPQDFRDRLKKCMNLRELHYSAGLSDGLDVMLAGYIPNSVEKLTLRFTRSLSFLCAFDDWIAHATDPTWLPHLKSFKMTIDSESRVRDLKAEEGWPSWSGVKVDASADFTAERFDQEFEVKRRELYGLLKTNRSFIELLY